jgi:hypothetical protein
MSLGGFDVLISRFVESISGHQYLFFRFYSVESPGER